MKLIVQALLTLLSVSEATMTCLTHEYLSGGKCVKNRRKRPELAQRMERIAFKTQNKIRISPRAFVSAV
jgi:hypothetical protein